MVVLVADRTPSQLASLIEYVGSQYPGAKVAAYTDPGLAVKFSISNPVDILCCDTDNEEDGEFANMIKHFAPKVKVRFPEREKNK